MTIPRLSWEQVQTQLYRAIFAYMGEHYGTFTSTRESKLMFTTAVPVSTSSIAA